MDQKDVAAILEEIGTLLELQGENPFRCQAYHRAARALEQLETNLAEIVAQGKLREIPGVGETLQEKITLLVTTGQLPFYDDLRSRTPAGLLQMLRVPGLGPKKVKAVYEELGIDDLDKLKTACLEGRVAQLKGFGAKTQQKILEGIEFLGQTAERVRIDQALPLAQAVIDQLKACPEVVRLELCGSLRRRRETIKDIDILVSSADPATLMKAFVSLPQVIQVVAHGDTKSSVVVAEGAGDHRVTMNADLRVVRDDQFPFALHYFTGSKPHNIAMRSRAQKFGLKLNEYELAGPKGSIACKDETDIFKALELDYIPPELREDTGEIAAAIDHQLPRLIEVDDIQGVFHCHTNWSDGAATLEEMAEAARHLGLHYLGIADHSQSLTVANGLSPERVRQQQAEIDRLNRKAEGGRMKDEGRKKKSSPSPSSSRLHPSSFRLFKGIECDILPDGRLDYDDELLATFDYVVASVHTHFGQSEADMTARIIRAIRHPCVTMLGHATGRLLLRRDSYKVDLEAVLRAASEHQTLIEINAHPMRLDLDWVHCKRARALGVRLVINPDAHSTRDLDYYRYGVDVARRGWLEKKDVFNTQTAAQVTKALAHRQDDSSSARSR